MFDWGNNNELLQKKAEIINELYQSGNSMLVKAGSVFLETFLFYSSFFTPLYFLGTSRMVNVAEIIRLIIRDESVHGSYAGYKFKKTFDSLSDEEQVEMTDLVTDKLLELYKIEKDFVHELYDEVGQEDENMHPEEVLKFVRYNANKALQNLGLDEFFPESHQDINPLVANGMSADTSNHDFFSSVGNGYIMGEVEGMKDDDYSMIPDSKGKIN